MSWTITPRFTQWTPADISTALWLDAADASTVTTVSGAVSQWNDKSGNGRNATQATAANRPVTISAALNSRSVVEFNPASNNYQSLGFSRLTTLGHVFFVAKKNNVNDSSFVLDDVNTDTRGVNYGAGAGSTFTVQSLAPTNSGATRNVWHIAEIATDGTNATLGIDATRVTAADADRYSVDRIGEYNNNNLNYRPQYSFRGQLAELIISATVFSSTDRQKLEGYLANKWGLTANLPNDHPYKVNPPAP